WGNEEGVMTKAEGSQNHRMMKEETSLFRSWRSYHSSLICHSTFGFCHLVDSWNPSARHGTPNYLRSLAMARYTYVAPDSCGQEATGLPLVRSLTVLAKQERDKVLKNTINSLSDSVQSGNTFSDALALHPRIFNNLYVNMVKAGEVGGVLEMALNRLSEFQEKAAKIKNKVIAAMVYPLIVMTMAVGIMAFLLVFIVPKFEAIFHDMLGDKPLPAVTQFVIGTSSLVKNHG